MKGTFIDFMKLASENPELAQELVDLAMKYDFQFTDQVTDEQLEGVAGGVDDGTPRMVIFNPPPPTTSSAFPRSGGDESGSATGGGIVSSSYPPRSGGDVKGTGGGT